MLPVSIRAGAPLSRVDSLRIALASATDMVERWSTLIRLAQAHRSFNIDSSTYYHRKALMLAQKASNKDLEARSWRAMAELDLMRDARGEAGAWWDSARTRFERALVLHEALADSIGLVTTLSLAGLQFAETNPPLALQWATKAQRWLSPSVLAQWQERPDLRANLARSRSGINETLGWSYFQLGRFSEARVELEKALDTSTRNGLFLFGIRAKLMDVAEQMHDDELMLRIGRDMLSDLDRMHVTHGQFELRAKLIRAYVHLGRCDSALRTSHVALREAEKEREQGELGPYLVGSVHASTALCLARRGDRNSALEHLYEAQDALRRTKDDASILMLVSALSEAYSELGSHREALQMRDSAYRTERRLLGVKERGLMLQFQELYDAQGKEHQIRELEQEARIRVLQVERERRNLVMTAGAALMVLAAAGLWFRTDRRRRKERFEREAAQLETQALRSQMNPHFIFNALNSIHAYIQQQDPDRAGSFVTKFARVMRSVLENSRHAEVPLRDDLDTLKAYMDLERQRSGSFDYSVEVDPEVDQDEVLVPPLVVQPFVENAIWHGMAGREGKGHITLRVERRGGQLTYIIQDDGVGRKAAPPTPQGHPIKKTSLGTAITRSRLDLVQKQHGGKAGFRYVDLDVGTRVEVDMPLLTAT
ncbi:MAG: histidine kinase [Flavobacteriales bacterium]|nr:histidine kinase [Flavobacteriales bacterium]